MARSIIRLNYTELSNCEATTGWADSGDADATVTASLIATTTTAAREGSNRIEWGVGDGAGAGGIAILKFTFQGGTTIDITQNEIGCWFLLPKGNAAGESPVLNTTTGALRIRLYSSAGNYADYYIGNDNTLPGGWQWIRCSGNSPDATTGSPNYSAINAFGIYTDNANENDATAKGGGAADALYGVDFVCAYDKIKIIGFDQSVSASSPSAAWTVDGIYDLCVSTKNDTDNLKDPNNFIWGMIQKEDVFYRFFAGLEFGDGSTWGEFVTENRYLYFKPVSSDIVYDLVIKDKMLVTFGKKDIGSIRTYARNGCQIINEIQGVRRGNIAVESGGEFNIYAGRIQNWNRLNLGSGGDGKIEVIKTDFFDNVTLELKSTNLTFEDVRCYLPSGGDISIGTVYNVPSELSKIQIFLNTDSLTFRVSTKVDEYVAGDNTYDLVVLEGINVDLVNSIFDRDKLKRVT